MKKFLPLILIGLTIVLLTITSVLLTGTMHLEFIMRMFMGWFFLIFAGFKIYNLQAFATAYQKYDIVAMRSRTYALLYPFIELMIAAGYLLNYGGIWRDLFTFIIMGVSLIGVVKKLIKNETIQCACLGMVFILPMTWVTLMEDLFMMLEAGMMVLMRIGFNTISIERGNEVLISQLKIHESAAEWVWASEFGHKMFAVIFLSIIVLNILQRKQYKFIKKLSLWIAVLLIISGSALSFVDTVFHCINDDCGAVFSLLLNPFSQWFQHFAGGILMIGTGLLYYFYTKQQDRFSYGKYAFPVFAIMTGIVFFFHQQLGALDAVISAMYWHMTFGGILIVGGIMGVFDILFSHRIYGFFVAWIVLLGIGSAMMFIYTEPPGSYNFASPEEEQQFQQELIAIKQDWSL